jgi:iron complex outermembrane receptor protein
MPGITHVRIVTCPLLISIAVLSFAIPVRATAELRIRVDLAAQPLRDALLELSRVAGLNIVIDQDVDMSGLRSAVLQGELSVDEAFEHLLAGTRLRAVRVDEYAVRIELHRQGAAGRGAGRDRDSSTPRLGNQATDRRASELPVVTVTGTVTGTQISMLDPFSPISSFSVSDLWQRGYPTVDRALEQLPANFPAISRYSNPIVGNAPGSVYNQTFASSVDLGGLGPGTTLILLNGHRLPRSVIGQAVDIASIPMSVVERVDVVRDGASATYGSDALGGVVNIITARDRPGITMTAQSEGIGDSQGADRAVSVLGGTDWSSGSVLGTLGYDEQRPLYASARPFTETSPAPTTVIPEQRSVNGYLSLQNRLGEKLVYTLEALGYTRSHDADDSMYGQFTKLSGRADQVSFAAVADYPLSSAVSLELSAEMPWERDRVTTAYPTHLSVDRYLNENPSFVAKVQGKLLKLFEQDVYFASGASVSQERFEWEPSYIQGISQSRLLRSYFAEIRGPVVAPSAERFLMQELSFDFSARHDHYSDFGGNVSWKLALRWQMSSSVRFDSSYARSFRAPSLYERYSVPFAQIVDNASPTDPATNLTTLLIDGGNSKLTPERAQSIQIQLSYRPAWLEGLETRLSQLWVNYNDRIEQLNEYGISPTEIVENASAVGSLLTLNPTQAQIEQALRTPGLTLVTPVDPQQVRALAHTGFVNAGSRNVALMDATIHYSHDFGFARAVADVSGSYYQKYEDRITPQSPGTSFVGTPYHPARFRAEINLALARDPWRANASLHYISGYGSSACLQDNCANSGWLTFDPSLTYTHASGGSSLLEGIQVVLSVRNALDRWPPFVRAGGLNFDPANASPLGRMFVVMLSKSWGGPERDRAGAPLIR